MQRFELTSRMKDFYDIFYISKKFCFDGVELKTAILKTLECRKTPYDKDSFKRLTLLANNSDLRKRWTFFLEELNYKKIEFEIIIKNIQIFLEPVFNAIVNETDWKKHWNYSTKWI